MVNFFDSVAIRVLVGIVVALLILALRYSFDIWQFLTKRDFGNVNVYLVLFTRNDVDSKDDRVNLELLGYKIPLREICRNRFLFWLIIWRSLRTTKECPVLNFGGRRNVLSPVRGRVSAIWSSMMLKRAAGMPHKRLKCELSLVYDRPDDDSNYLIRVVLIRSRDLEKFDQYLKKPPENSNNFAFVTRIVEAYQKKTGDFITVRITVA